MGYKWATTTQQERRFCDLKTNNEKPPCADVHSLRKSNKVTVAAWY